MPLSQSLRTILSLLLVGMPLAVTAGEDDSAVAEYQSLHLTKDPKAAVAGEYKLDPHHTSVVAKLAHMDLSRYTLRFNDVKGQFTYNPANPAGTPIEITIDPKSVDTGDQAFNTRIAAKYFEIAKFPTITFTSTAIRPAGDHGQIEGILDFHGVKKPVLLTVIYRGFTDLDNRMGFSAEFTFKRSDFGVGIWVPLESDDVTILIETEFVKPPA